MQYAVYCLMILQTRVKSHQKFQLVEYDLKLLELPTYDQS